MATHSSISHAWEISWTEEPGSSQGHKELDTTEVTQHALMTISQFGFPWWLSGGESLPAMQQMPVLSLVWEDPTFYGVTGPLRCNY